LKERDRHCEKTPQALGERPCFLERLDMEDYKEKVGGGILKKVLPVRVTGLNG